MVQTQPVQVRFDGQEHVLAEHAQDVCAALSDDEIRARLARHFRVHCERFRYHAVDRAPSGRLILRPWAVFG